MAKTVSFGRIYQEYLNGFHFHCTEIKARKGEKLSALVHILSISVVTDITTYQLLGDQPELLEQIITLINVNSSVFMDYLLSHGNVSTEEHAEALEEFKKAYDLVAHRIQILFNVNLPSVNQFMPRPEEAKQPSAQSEEIPESKIILTK